MPESLLDSRSEFDRVKAVLGRVLRSSAHSVRALTVDVLRIYGSHRFVAGWSLSLPLNGGTEAFHVLIDEEFPYSPIRVAYKTQDAHLKWPHVEGAGLLCLPRVPAPFTNVEQAGAVALSDALALVDQCQDPRFVKEELRREFLSYWDFSKDGDTKRIRSLLDTSNRKARKIAVWFGKRFTLVGESTDQLVGWLANIGRTEQSEIEQGFFAYLNQAPTFPFPRSPNDLLALLRRSAPDALQVMGRLSILSDVTVVLAAAGSPSGDGQISMSIARPSSFQGFRKSNQISSTGKLALWARQSELKRSAVERFDAPWVHGRGFNTKLPALRGASVLVLGCGSLGSQVAARLAQAGVGKLALVDPQLLAAANVGRHELGIISAGYNKASELGEKLRTRFPHAIEIKGYPTDWQTVYSQEPAVFEQSTLIVACIGEWGADGQLGEWMTRRPRTQTTVFGWLDEHGVASHALALKSGTPALSCVMNSEGSLRIPETLWEGGARVQSEPACGTLFQPYGPLDVARAEALVSRLCVEVLTAKVEVPCHRVYAGSTAQLSEAGGDWAPEHRKHRPPGFEGPFEYQRPLAPCGRCAACRAGLS